MKTVPEGLRPEWDRKFPGRLDWELERLNAQARNIEFDEAALKNGSVELDLEWPVNGEWIPLRAVYPATYPDARPHVRLRTARETWPLRHIAPVDGSLCLLGRNPRQWRPDDGLAGLLMLQLPIALHGGGAEDPQAEPMEVWWNQDGLRESYCLVDSAWDLSGAEGGTITARVVTEPARKRFSSNGQSLPAIRMVITEVRDASGATLARWEGPLPPALTAGRDITTRWVRSPGTLRPGGTSTDLMTQLRRDHLGAQRQPHPTGNELAIRLDVFVHPIELTEGVSGDGWLVHMQWGRVRDFAQSGRKPSNPVQGAAVPVYRAGASDLGTRVPAFSALTGKKVAIVGVGAIGAPIALELARNGVAELRLMDPDVVEPGNSVRWPLGAKTWGMPKVQALAEHIAEQYPRCRVVPVHHMIGALGPNEAPVLDSFMDGADIVVDASASSMVNIVMWRRCQDRNVLMVKVAATPQVRGGTVMVHAPSGPCPTCLDIARDAGRAALPAGQTDAGNVQPIGCAEPTFPGADYDLQELSLQAVRAAIDALQEGASTSTAYSLSLRDDAGRACAPRWTMEEVLIEAACSNHLRVRE